SIFILRPSTFVLRPSSFFLLPSSFFLLPSSFVLLPSSFFLRPSSLVLLFWSLLLLPSSLVVGQQDPLFTQYMYTKLEFNPAYSGSRDALAADLLTRFQWVGVDGAPRTTCLTVHTPLRNPHIGLGVYMYRDELGPTVDYNVMASFAYRILFPASKLAFGVSAGIKYYNIDWNVLHPLDPVDQLLVNDASNRVVPDVDFGIYYSHARYYAGISVKHLLQNQMIVSSTAPTGEATFTRLRANFYGIAGGTISLASKFVFLPSVLVKYVANAPVQADINARFLLLDILTLGVGYRTNSAIDLMVGVDVGKGFSVGYSYDIWFNALRSHNSGSHEIRISYETDLFKRTRMLTPRYF
ncbi:MAG: type IX secretion system membrane protein PorP/SprF, partial [Bacteroidales bacterium]|nr:type IX secretion system membrane protein PorP/SprF [Bacteroidales bacterium]